MMTITNKTQPSHLYLHVPFCSHICGYCDFAHVVYQNPQADSWLEAVERELKEKKISTSLTTVYIGGGTPTSLSAQQLQRLLSDLDPYVSQAKEYTIEINPETLDEEKCQILKDHGINRASIGFESSDPKLLALMGRHHDYACIERGMTMLKKYGIENISLDLMYSLPFQTMEMLQKSVEDALQLQPRHLSLYSLTVEENTVFGKKGYRNLDEDEEADMYEWICSFLPQNGFTQYEVSNFCRDGYESLHNLGYWHYDDFYGIGCGASGKENHVRYDHPKNLRSYLEDPLYVEKTELSQEDEMFEMLMMGVRLKKGMDLHLFEKRFGCRFDDVYKAPLERMISSGNMIVENGYLKCTDRGYEIMNTLLVEFLSA